VVKFTYIIVKLNNKRKLIMGCRMCHRETTELSFTGMCIACTIADNQASGRWNNPRPPGAIMKFFGILGWIALILFVLAIISR